MHNPEVENKILEIRRRDPRYSAQAYWFIFEALDFTIRKLGRLKSASQERHISGRELLEGIRESALESFGPMARVVVESWGVQRTTDFGEIVFNMVDAGLLSKQATDVLEDFKDVFDFEEAFDKGYRVRLPRHLTRH
ncbi:MAG: hypothetical protein RL885_16505 [Planctomycetota bacterium]